MTIPLPFSEPRPRALRLEIENLAKSGGFEERGAVYTKRTVVEAILDLAGYVAGMPLHEQRLLEPSFGEGDFLLPVIRRLVQAFRASRAPMKSAYDALRNAIRAVELHRPAFESGTKLVSRELVALGFDEGTAGRLAAEWLINDDFLLSDLRGRFDFVVGNPPYVRQERLSDTLLREYKRRFSTLYDRADLYVLFFERGLDLLTEVGVLGFICANRWMKNKYGGPLREKVASDFHLEFYVDLERADAFQTEVIAYPAITLVRRGTTGRTMVASGHRDNIEGLSQTVQHLMASKTESRRSQPGVVSVSKIAVGSDPWLLDAPKIIKILRNVERSFPILEESGAKVGIGVATGADKVFIADYDELPVEAERKLPLATVADCVDGRVTWGGKGIVNPYLESGDLAALERYPRFAGFLQEHDNVLKRRHTARRQPTKWYRTIDRIYPGLTFRPKLLIPDIKGEANVCYDPGECYPHHNLYVVTSDVWDLRALQAVLRSSVSLMFVAAYGVRMAGGFLRFQAQYLRRIRCPDLKSISLAQLAALRDVAESADQDTIDDVVLPLYGLHGASAQTVREYARRARVKPTKK